MKRTLWTTIALLPFLSVALQAQPPGRGPHGGGPGGGGGGGGPLPAEARETIHTLFSEHQSIERKVTLTKTGYKSRTVSKDPKLVAKLQEHVAAMETRLDAGFPVRRWDPAFEEFFQHYDQLDTKITKIKNGLKVEVTGKTPEAIKVAQNHANIITGFVKKGDVQHHAEHPAALAAKAAGDQPAQAAKAAGPCKDCKGACEGQAAGPKGKPAATPKQGPCKDCKGACEGQAAGPKGKPAAAPKQGPCKDCKGACEGQAAGPKGKPAATPKQGPCKDCKDGQAAEPKGKPAPKQQGG